MRSVSFGKIRMSGVPSIDGCTSCNDAVREMSKVAKPEPQYKDRLFSFIFGSEEHKDWTLSLYNAVNHSSYTEVDDISITTIRQVLYMGMRNDVSFMIAGEINMYEQQSSYNPNMPLRMLQYAGQLYEKDITQRRMNKYGQTLIDLPVPRLVVFYNGTDAMPDEKELYLSDAFPERQRALADIQVHVRMVNVNMGHSSNLLSSCKPLMEYAWIVKGIRGLEKVAGLESAIDQTIDALPNDFLTKPYLEAHRAEVKTMLLTEYNEARQLELTKEEGRREGRQEGETMFSSLVLKLTALGRDKDIVKAASDPAYRTRLYQEFQIN